MTERGDTNDSDTKHGDNTDSESKVSASGATTLQPSRRGFAKLLGAAGAAAVVGTLAEARPAGAITGGWSVNGNSGTTSPANYVGTSDAQPLSIATNHTERIHITGVLGTVPDTGDGVRGTAGSGIAVHGIAATAGRHRCARCRSERWHRSGRHHRHRLRRERDRDRCPTGDERGRYLMPEIHGAPADRRIGGHRRDPAPR